MPPRITIAAIISFWLGMTAWLIEREVVPMMLAEDAPSYKISLTDEIGTPLVNWIVLSNGKRVGTGTSSILAHEDHTYEFRSNLNLERVSIAGLAIKRLESMYRVTEKGKLEAMAAKFNLSTFGAKLNFGMPEVVEIQGEATGDELPLRLLIDGEENKIIALGKIDLRRQGNVVNSMHMVSRLRGLRVGQTWKITFLKLPSPTGENSLSSLIAEVKSDRLPWNKREVACFKIEYYQPGTEDIAARTWVRKLDGLVLQQQAHELGFELTMQRVPD